MRHITFRDTHRAITIRAPTTNFEAWLPRKSKDRYSTEANEIVGMDRETTSAKAQGASA